MISQPLNALHKKNAFQWNNEAQSAFENRKQDMISSPGLALPDFNETFVIETYALGVGI